MTEHYPERQKEFYYEPLDAESFDLVEFSRTGADSLEAFGSASFQWPRWRGLSRDEIERAIGRGLLPNPNLELADQVRN